jgi:hypothetical protein
MRDVLRLRLLVPCASALLAAAVLVGFGAAFASAATKPNSPTITITSPTEGQTLTSSSVSVAFTYNRTPKQTKTLTCALSGPTSFPAVACDAPTAIPGDGSQSGKSYSGLANGSYTFTARLTLGDGGTASATRHFTVNVPPACSVVNTRTSTTYSDLQTAIDAATAGDELDITGTCTGNYGVTENLTLKGIDTAGVKATLDGNNAGRTLTVFADTSVTVYLQNLRITKGKAGDVGGGIFNIATLIATNVVVTHNSAADQGGGVWSKGSLSMAQSEVTSNSAGTEGGGIALVTDADCACTTDSTLTATTVSNNTAGTTGGGIFLLYGAGLTLDSSSITGNAAGQSGGGIEFLGSSLSGTATITGNTPDNCDPDNIIPGCT